MICSIIIEKRNKIVPNIIGGFRERGEAGRISKTQDL
jgi:hypothetical protein